MRVNLFRGRQGSGEATFVATTNRPSRCCATATLVELQKQQKSASACYFFDRRVSGRCLGLLEKILQTLRGKKNPRVSIWILFLVPISNGNIVVTEEFAEKWKYSDGGSLTGQHR